MFLLILVKTIWNLHIQTLIILDVAMDTKFAIGWVEHSSAENIFTKL